MLKKILVAIILIVSLCAKSKERFQVLANSVDTKNDILVAKGDVVIFSPTYYILAQRAIYDKNEKTLELFGDVVVLKDNNIQNKSDYALLDMKNNNSYQKPSLIFEDSSSLWINSSNAQKKGNIFNFHSSILSSCDCENPDWSVRASNIDYDAKKHWINTYNTRLYFKNVPVFYTPYWGFATNKKRKTGFLSPTIGYSKSKGISYFQPIYIAPASNYDIELIPQLRFKRGSGMYAHLRYADSINSILKVSGGYFREKQKYVDEFKLRNKDHYGLDINYKRDNLLTKNSKDKQDGLYLSINYLNDIEYKTLEDYIYSQSLEQKIESKINYIYGTPEYFLGSYIRYYIDTQSATNTKTLQELPKLQFHIYSKPFLDKLMYSTDIKYTNHFRETSINTNEYELNLPLSYSFSLFDDYLQLTLKQLTSFTKFQYSKEEKSFENGQYLKSNSIVSLSTDLVKSYKNYLHTINLSANYTNARDIVEDGDLYPISNKNSILSPFPISRSKDNITLNLNQFLFDTNDLRQIINHRLTQSILYDKFDNPKLQNIENEIKYNYILGAIYGEGLSGNLENKMVYNHQDKKFVENSSSFSLYYDDLGLKLGRYSSKHTPNSSKDDLQSYQIDLKYDISNKYSIQYQTNYNILEHSRSKQSLIFSIKDNCWDLNLNYEREIEAASTKDGQPLKQDILYLKLVLKSLGGINQRYEINDGKN